MRVQLQLSTKSTLRVMLVDDNESRADFVEGCLRHAGFEEILAVPCGRGLLLDISNWTPDVIVIDMESPDRDLLESLSIVNDHNPTPIVMFSQSQDSDYMQRAVEAGVSTYLVEGVQPETVRPIIEVAMMQFKSYQQLRQERDDARDELQQRRIIEKAKYALMKHEGFNEDEAYEEMRKLAMQRNQKMADLADEILSLEEGRD